MGVVTRIDDFEVVLATEVAAAARWDGHGGEIGFEGDFEVAGEGFEHQELD